MKKTLNHSSVTDKGQVTIPASYREMLGLKPHDLVHFTLEGERLILEPVRSRLQTFHRALSLPAGARPLTAEELRDVAEQAWAKEAMGRTAP
jgi:AbrB family looped-hinge helix DNA binding protein